MKKLLILSALILSACGGGDGFSSTPVGPSTSTSAFALNTAITNFYSTPRTFSLNAQVDGRALNLTLNYSPLPDTLFEGQVSKANQATVTLFENNVNQGSSTISRFFSTNPLLFRGASTTGDPDGQNYLVISTANSLPASANVNTSGPLVTGQYFTNSTKISLTGSEVVTYTVEPDTANTAFLCTNATLRNQVNTILLTQSECIKINPAGDILGLKIFLGEYTDGDFDRTIQFQ